MVLLLSASIIVKHTDVKWLFGAASFLGDLYSPLKLEAWFVRDIDYSTPVS